MKSSRISKATRREWLNKIGTAAAAAGIAGAETALRPLQPRRRPATVLTPEMRRTMREANRRRPQSAEQWKKLAGDISSKHWLDKLPEVLYPETLSNLALQYIQGMGASVYRHLVQKPEEPVKLSMRSRALNKATRRQLAARIGTVAAALGSAGGAALLTRTTPVGPSKPANALTNPEPEDATPAIMKTRPLSGIEYSFPVPEGKWRTTQALHEEHLHGPDSPIHDAIWHASAATGIDPAYLTALHGTETQGHEIGNAGNYEKPHYGVEKRLSGKPHIGQDFDRRGNKYDHTFGPFQLSREAFEDAWQGKPPKELDQYGGDIHMALLHDPYIAAMTAAKYLTHIRNNYVSHASGMRQNDKPLKALITAALYNRGAGFAGDYKGLKSYGNWLKGIHGEYGPRLLYNYEELGGTYAKLNDAIDIGDKKREPEMTKMKEINRSFRATPFPHAMWPHEAGLAKASRREMFGMGGEKPPAGEVSAPKGEPAPEKPSLLSRVMDKFKIGRRSALQTGATVATNPSAALGGAANMAVQAALPAVGAAASLAGGIGKEALAHMIGKLRSAPSAGTWMNLDGNAGASMGLPLVRDAKTGLLGMLIPGASRIVGHMDGIGNGPQGTERARMLYWAGVLGNEKTYGKGAIPEWTRSPIMRRLASMYGAGGMAAITGSKYFERMMQTYKNSGPRKVGVSDVVRQALPEGAQDGYGVYVLPPELQSRHAGKPLAHVDGPAISSGAFELEPVSGETEMYARIHDAIDKHRNEGHQVDVPGWDKSNLDSIIRSQIGDLDNDHDLALQMLKKIRDAKATGIPLSPKMQEQYDLMREQGWHPEELDANQQDLLSHVSGVQTKSVERVEDATPLADAKKTINKYKQDEARAEAEMDAQQVRAKQEAARKKDEGAKAEYSRSRQQRQRQWNTANLAERAERGQTGANMYLPYERSFRNADLDRLEKALKQSFRKSPTESGLSPDEHALLMQRFFPNEAPASTPRPATPATPATPVPETLRGAGPRQDPDEEPTTIRSIKVGSQPFLSVKTHGGQLIAGVASSGSGLVRANEDHKRMLERIAAKHVAEGTLTDGSEFLNLGGLAMHQADLVAKEYVKWYESGDWSRPDLSKYRNPVARRKDGTEWDYRDAFKRMIALDKRATQYDYKHGSWDLSRAFNDFERYNILNPYCIWDDIRSNIGNLEHNPRAIFPSQLKRAGLQPHQYMYGVQYLMNLGLHHGRLSHLTTLGT